MGTALSPPLSGIAPGRASPLAGSTCATVSAEPKSSLLAGAGTNSEISLWYPKKRWERVRRQPGERPPAAGPGRRGRVSRLPVLGARPSPHPHPPAVVVASLERSPVLTRPSAQKDPGTTVARAVGRVRVARRAPAVTTRALRVHDVVVCADVRRPGAQPWASQSRTALGPPARAGARTRDRLPARRRYAHGGHQRLPCRPPVRANGACARGARARVRARTAAASAYGAAVQCAQAEKDCERRYTPRAPRRGSGGETRGARQRSASVAAAVAAAAVAAWRR